MTGETEPGPQIGRGIGPDPARGVGSGGVGRARAGGPLPARGGAPNPGGGSGPGPEIAPAPGLDPLTDAVLARYLVGRAVEARVSVSLMLLALVVLAGAAALWVWGPRWLGVIVALVAMAVAAFRALLMAILRRVLAVGRLGRAEDRIQALVADTGGDLRRELRRIGLPGSTLGLPLLAWRLLGRRRAETLGQLGRFDVSRVVPKARRDEMAFVVRTDILGRPRARP